MYLALSSTLLRTASYAASVASHRLLPPLDSNIARKPNKPTAGARSPEPIGQRRWLLIKLHERLSVHDLRCSFQYNACNCDDQIEANANPPDPITEHVHLTPQAPSTHHF
jgi:hypothetical protein